MATITSVDHYANERKFKRVAKGIYEIKIPGIRLYCFKDEIEAPQERIPKLIVATNGGTKNTAREQQRDIDRAQEIRDRYLHAKSDPDTTLNYVTVNDED